MFENLFLRRTISLRWRELNRRSTENIAHRDINLAHLALGTFDETLPTFLKRSQNIVLFEEGHLLLSNNGFQDLMLRRDDLLFFFCNEFSGFSFAIKMIGLETEGVFKHRLVILIIGLETVGLVLSKFYVRTRSTY